MCHIDAPSRSINRIEQALDLSREIIIQGQRNDDLCLEYTHHVRFWRDEDGMLHNQASKGQPRVVIPQALIPTVLIFYHDLRSRTYVGL
jgi:hypothetical protein